MTTGHFYFLDDQYFIDFPDEHLMSNKNSINGVEHNRPCFYAFQDQTCDGIYWMIPLSSRVQKYQKIFNEKMRRFGRCDTIVFGDILGHKKVFLIQNMFPVIDKYIKNEYRSGPNNHPVQINGVLEREILAKARRVLALQRNGKKLLFPDSLAIEDKLKKMLP